MQTLKIKATKDSPEVNFDSQTGKFSISGICNSSHTVEFFEPIYLFIDAYSKSPLQSSVFTFQLEYLNSSAQRCVMDLLKRIKKMHDSGKEVKIQWCYPKDEEEMLDEGKSFSNLFKFPFEFIPY
jgi:hypothetical protein